MNVNDPVDDPFTVALDVESAMGLVRAVEQHRGEALPQGSTTCEQQFAFAVGYATSKLAAVEPEV